MSIYRSMEDEAIAARLVTAYDDRYKQRLVEVAKKMLYSHEIRATTMEKE